MHARTAALALLAGLAWASPTPAQDKADAPAPSPAPAPAPAAAGDSVTVLGKRDAVEQRRLSTASKIVVTREDIEQFGDSTLADVIKRLPSVTVGGRPGRRGGQIRMRGMGNGYTQILIDGERVPPGFSIEDLSPDQIERIEIYRAPTAETGARAIAGTINIVLREPLRQRGDDLRVGAGYTRGGWQPGASWTRNDVLGEHGTYNLTLSANHGDTTTDTLSTTTYTDLSTGQLALQQDKATRSQERRDAVHLNGRVQWVLGPGEQLSLQPLAVLNQSRSSSRGTLAQPVGSAPAPYAASTGSGSAHSAMLRLQGQGRLRVGDGARLELRGGIGGFQSDSSSLLDEADASGAGVYQQSTDTRINDRSWNFTGKLSQAVLDQHNVVAGLEGEGVRRNETTANLSNGQPQLADFDGDVHASTQRVAVYAQDEWDLSREWSAYAGLRWESIRTRSSAGSLSLGPPVENTGRVLTPLAHAVWRFNAPARDQLRLSLTRSYRPPTLANLIAVPRLSTLYPAPGANTAVSSDRAGNPALRPELARGLDVALEHYLAAGGVMSISAFSRQITDLIRNVTTLETVSWATQPRWVTRPQNVGGARTQGIELDAKFRLDELMQPALPLTLRGNLGLYRSQVSGVPGPNNRIDSQPRLSANLGADWKLASLPLTLGANLNVVPGYTVQQSDTQSQGVETTRVLDGYALWQLQPGARLRLSLSNIVPRNYVTTASVLASGQDQVTVSNGPSYRVVSLRLELKM